MAWYPSLLESWPCLDLTADNPALRAHGEELGVPDPWDRELSGLMA
jgi:hypothetical protein